MDKIISKNQKTETKGSKMRSALYVIVFIVALVIAIPIGKWAMQSFISLIFSNGTQSGGAEESLIQASADMNKTLPKMVDSVTQLTTTNASGQELIYSYKLLTDNSISQNDLDNSLKSNITNGACSTAETKKLLDMGVGLIYSYSDSNGKYIGKIPVYLSNCE